MSSDRLPKPPAVPAEARAVALTWRPPARVCDACECEACWCGQLYAEPVDASPMAELGSLRADLRTIERVHGWYDENEDE